MFCLGIQVLESQILLRAQCEYWGEPDGHRVQDTLMIAVCASFMFSKTSMLSLKKKKRIK